MKRDIPCPVQRALARAGHLSDVMPIRPFAELLERAFGIPLSAGGHLLLTQIAGLANGARWVARNLREGFRPHELRGGPFDKRGAGTRIYTQDGRFDPIELERFVSFARPYPGPDGSATEELGWGRPELTAYLDANQERSGCGWYTRHVLMEGELPVLLRFMGKGRGAARHLAVADVRDLFEHERFPERVEQRLQGRTV